MKTRLGFAAIAFCLLVAAAAPAAAAPAVNGYLHDVNGQRVLRVWGTYYEMGYAHGVLMGDEVMELMDGYILALLPPVIYDLLHDIVPVLFGMPEEYWEEAQGIIDGIADGGASPMIADLGRRIDVYDLLVANAVGDIGAMACSAELAWDGATAGDPKLQSETAVVRNLDWKLAGDDPFLLPRRTFVLVATPTDPPGQTVASVTFPGYFGCLSCMNDLGLTAVVNIAHNGVPLWDNSFMPWFIPIGFSLRQALHAKDYNGDGFADLDDIIDDVKHHRRSGAVVINLAMPAVDTAGDPAMILEVDNAGTAVRTPLGDEQLPDDVLLSTNELRLLRPAEGCDRYETMVDDVQDLGGHLTLDDMWSIAGDVLQISWLTTTSQTIYFLPADREMGVAYSDGVTISAKQKPKVLTWEDMSELPDGVDLSDDDTDQEPAGDDDDDDDEGCGC